MRLAPPAAAAVISTFAFAMACAPASALAGNPGGSQAPSAPTAGGLEYGLTVPAQSHPAINLLRVPSSAIAGRPPRVTVRLDEKGVATVYLQVRIVNLATRHSAVLADMGWSHTGRTLTVAWPPSATLSAGSYQVRVSAHDHRGANLVRHAHSSGEATLTVRAAPPPPRPPPAPVPPPPAVEPGVPTPAETAAAGAVFPVAGAHNFGGPENRFGAPRGTHTHQGQDVMTAEGTPVLAPLAGVVESTSFQEGVAGYYVVEHTGVGFDFMFAHCQAGSFAVSARQGVSAGQQLCRAGQTGDATAPHLHFEIWVGGWQASGGHPIDPLPYLEAWDRTGPTA
jgi:Peptidase family M23